MEEKMKKWENLTVLNVNYDKTLEVANARHKEAVELQAEAKRLIPNVR